MAASSGLRTHFISQFKRFSSGYAIFATSSASSFQYLNLAMCVGALLSDINTTNVHGIGNYALNLRTHLVETYTVRIVIENKPGINDPEGETILHDLILKGSDSKIKDVRVAKMLTVKVQEKSPDDAKKRIRKMCDEMRIYNPMVSQISISVSKIRK